MSVTPPTVEHPWGTPDLGLALAKTYLLLQQASKECPVGPVVAAGENLAETMRSFGYLPEEAERIVAEHQRVAETWTVANDGRRVIRGGIGHPAIIATAASQELARQIVAEHNEQPVRRPMGNNLP